MINALWVVVAMSPSPAAAYTSARCSVDVEMSKPRLELALEQQVGSEQLDCVKDGNGEVTAVRVLRRAVASSSAKASARAHARARASADCSESCTVSCSGSCSCSSGGSCRTSDQRTCWARGSDYDSCSDDESASGDAEDSRDTPFVVARAPIVKIAAKGYSARAGGHCQLVDPNGGALDMLRSIGLVLIISGEELLEGGALASMKGTEPMAVAAPGAAASEGAQALQKSAGWAEDMP